jgi:hypothetical protein
MGDFLGFCSSVVEVVWDVVLCHWVVGAMFWDTLVVLPSKSQNSQEDSVRIFRTAPNMVKRKILYVPESGP